MVVVSYSGREINAKIVYYGPGLSGKTTNLEKIYDSVPETNRGRMVSMKTQTDRTLFFDLLPLDLGELSGMKTRFLLYTVPGQVYYNATRKLVLKGVDALVFVADSAPDKMAENRESLTNLEQNLKSYGLDLKTIPWVLQFNKRDLPEALPLQVMNRELNRWNVPTYEAQAANGVGVFETLRGVSKLLLARISKDVVERDRGMTTSRKKEAAPAPEAAAPRGPAKLIQALKRGKGADAPPPAPETNDDMAPLLSEDALVEETPAPASYLEPTPLGSRGSTPATVNEEPTLGDDDLVFEREEPRGAGRRSGGGGLSDDEIERESSYEADRSPAVANGQSITVPIDIGSLPASGTIRVTFEIKVEVLEERTRSRVNPNTHMRDLESIS